MVTHVLTLHLLDQDAGRPVTTAATVAAGVATTVAAARAAAAAAAAATTVAAARVEAARVEAGKGRPKPRLRPSAEAIATATTPARMMYFFLFQGTCCGLSLTVDMMAA